MHKTRLIIMGIGVLLISIITIITFNHSAVSQDIAQTSETNNLPYVGIIKNKTKYDLSLPSLNSGATLVVPAKSWIEFTAWSPKFELDAYYNGMSVWCDNISVTPEKYQYMCKKYDFIAEIVQPETVLKKKHIPKKKRIKKKLKSEEGVEGLG